MTKVKVTAGPNAFAGHFEEKAATKTVADFRKHLPLVSEIIRVRWSGEGVWVPLGDMDFGVGFENDTCYPSPGQVILYPGRASETELLVGYGHVACASKAGPLSGNHFLTLTEGLENICALGREALLEGQQDIRFEIA